MYAIYFNDYERISAIEHDFWVAHSTVKLLSSKFPLCIPNILNSNCRKNYKEFDPIFSVNVGNQRINDFILKKFLSYRIDW